MAIGRIPQASSRPDLLAFAESKSTPAEPLRDAVYKPALSLDAWLVIPAFAASVSG
jgi:hypothetical protein